MSTRPHHIRKLQTTRQAQVIETLQGRSVVMVGLMGSGKTTVGRRLASALSLPFFDADQEIEFAAGMTISDIFESHGEQHFRDGERKVIARLATGKQCVLATGGGAFIDQVTRHLILNTCISIWLRGELALLLKRVSHRSNRPLLKSKPEVVMKHLIEERYPIYANANIMIESRDIPHELIVNEIITRLTEYDHQSNE